MSDGDHASAKEYDDEDSMQDEVEIITDNEEELEGEENG